MIFERSVGFRDLAGGDPLRPDAIWRIYSMTKPIVTAAAMVLVEAGLLCCDQPVAEFIPLFAQLRVADGAGRDVPARTPPTIQDLMRHTAGLSYGYHGVGPAHQAYVADGFLDEDLSNASFVDRLAALPLEHQPGTVWHYSHATDVLGRVLEVVSGHSLLQVLQKPCSNLSACWRHISSCRQPSAAGWRNRCWEGGRNSSILACRGALRAPEEVLSQRLTTTLAFFVCCWVTEAWTARAS